MKVLKAIVLPILIACLAGFANAQTWTSYTVETSGIADNMIQAIGVDSNNFLWFGTGNGLSCFNGSTWTTYTTDEGLAHNEITALAFEITSYGPEFWVGTNGGGVSVISVAETDAISAATPYTPDNTGLISNYVTSAAVDTGHVKWFGTDQGVSTFTGSEWASYTSLSGLSNDQIHAIDTAEDGWVYLGTGGGGVSRFDGITSASAYDTEWSGILSDVVYAVFVDADGNQWFGTDNGISYHVGYETKMNWTPYTTESGLVNNVVYAIAQDLNGVMWFGTENGVSSFDGTDWTTYTTENGLAGNTVYAITVDASGAVWFGTNAGVSRYGGEITAVEMPEGTPTLITIDGVFPNPFNPTATIEFSLPSNGYASVEIYNLAGQRVRQLITNDLTAGRHTAVWNGRDENGSMTASGIYIVRLNMNGITASQRMTLVR